MGEVSSGTGVTTRDTVQGKGRKRLPMSKPLRAKILSEASGICAYCGGTADRVDHIRPFSADPVDLEANLVAACRLCNALAGDKQFASFEAKRKWILQRRLERADLVSGRGYKKPPKWEPPKPDRKHHRRPIEWPVGGSAKAAVRRRLLEMNASGMGWRQIGEKLGVSPGTACRVAKGGYWPKRKDIRVALGVQRRPRKPKICPKCGAPVG